jgi:hypothetical protein
VLNLNTNVNYLHEEDKVDYIMGVVGLTKISTDYYDVNHSCFPFPPWGCKDLGPCFILSGSHGMGPGRCQKLSFEWTKV